LKIHPFVGILPEIIINSSVRPTSADLGMRGVVRVHVSTRQVIMGTAVSLVAIVTLFLGYWFLTPVELPQPAPPVTSADVREPPTCDYRGDRAGYAHKSKVIRKLHPDSAHALLVVANSELLCSRFVTSAALPAANVQALRQLANDPNAVEVFTELVTRAPPVGQIYGLVGLYAANRTAFVRLSAPFERMSHVVVPTLSGCIGSEAPVSAIVTDYVKTGVLAEQLLGHDTPAEVRGGRTNSRASAAVTRGGGAARGRRLRKA
jgi:hypothetical protein